MFKKILLTAAVLLTLVLGASAANAGYGYGYGHGYGYGYGHHAITPATLISRAVTCSPAP